MQWMFKIVKLISELEVANTKSIFDIVKMSSEE